VVSVRRPAAGCFLAPSSDPDRRHWRRGAIPRPRRDATLLENRNGPPYVHSWSHDSAPRSDNGHTAPGRYRCSRADFKAEFVTSTGFSGSNSRKQIKAERGHCGQYGGHERCEGITRPAARQAVRLDFGARLGQWSACLARTPAGTSRSTWMEVFGPGIQPRWFKPDGATDSSVICDLDHVAESAVRRTLSVLGWLRFSDGYTHRD
jgi:hypothetical protein